MAERRRRRVNVNALIGLTPMICVAVGLYVIGIAYTTTLSFTGSRLLPTFDDWVGLANYIRLWGEPRWQISLQNILIFGALVIGFNVLIGFILAACMDRKVRNENLLRTIFLYPYAMSLIVTGLAWQWMMDPNLGIQATVRSWGWESFSFAPLASTEWAIYGVVVAGLWQGAGVTMAILLAGLRGVDGEIWKAAKIDGIPVWKTYVFIILPMLRGALATVLVLQAIGVVRVYDLIVALTGGGPGIATEMPAKFVIDHIRDRLNVGLGMAAATLLLLPILVLLALLALSNWRRQRRMARAIRDTDQAETGAGVAGLARSE